MENFCFGFLVPLFRIDKIGAAKKWWSNLVAPREDVNSSGCNTCYLLIYDVVFWILYVRLLEQHGLISKLGFLNCTSGDPTKWQ